MPSFQTERGRLLVKGKSKIGGWRERLVAEGKIHSEGLLLLANAEASFLQTE